MKKLHLICNSHIDPTWLWEWEDGASAALATFRSAVRLAEQFDYIFCHNEASLYMWVEEYDAPLFERIRALVEAGKWHIMGGWYLQPDCNMPSGESFVRQIQVGKAYFKQKFNKEPTTAVNFDPFGHSYGLPQILKKCGYDSYLCCRPGKAELDIPDDFIWEGVDGSRVMATRASSHYNSAMGKAVEKISSVVKSSEKDVDVVLWGVGNHGGGPSAKDLADIGDYIKSVGFEAAHSAPEAYFADTKKRDYVLNGGLNPCMPGCYTSQIRVKQKHRALENALYSTEKLLSLAETENGLAYPAEELKAIERDLLDAEFHDILPGSAIKAVEEYGLRLLDSGLARAAKLRARALFSLIAKQKRAKAGEFPVVVSNTEPYPVKTTVDVSFLLEDQNWGDQFTNIVAYDGETPLKTQVVKERSNLTLDWVKRVVFEATLAPMSVSRFDCRKVMLEKKPAPQTPEKGDIVFDNGDLRAVIGRESGLIEGVTAFGKQFLKGGAFSFELFEDNADPWAMSAEQRVKLGRKPVGKFTLAEKEDNAYHCAGITPSLGSVRVIEDGDVLKKIEAMFTYRKSYLRAEYVFYKAHDYFDVNCDVFFMEQNKLLKMRVPCAFEGRIVNDIAFGREEQPQNGRECAMQKYTGCMGTDRNLFIVNDGVYGMSAEGSDIFITLLRGCCYSAHPVEGRPLLSDDRYAERVDQGERHFSFRIALGGEELERGIDALARQFNEKPFALCAFPDGEGEEKHGAPLTLDNDAVGLVCFKKSENGGYILRLHNNHAYANCVNVTVGGVCERVGLERFEVATFVYDGKTLKKAGSMLI